MKKNFVCTACGIVITVSLLLTGCKGNAAKTTDPSDALLATETTAATESTKATTKATTPKPTTKPTTGKNNAGKTETTKATEATKPAENGKPVETQKPTEAPKTNDSPKPTNPPATESPKPTNPPATQPPATEAPKPTDPPETEPEDPYPYDTYEAMEYGNSYAAGQGFIVDYSLSKYDTSYVVTTTVAVGTLNRNGGQSDLNYYVIEKVNGTMDELTAYYGDSTAEDWAYYRVRCWVEETTLYGEPAYEIYFLYT